jgi:hypothetical protein
VLLLLLRLAVFCHGAVIEVESSSTSKDSGDDCPGLTELAAIPWENMGAIGE